MKIPMVSLQTETPGQQAEVDQAWLGQLQEAVGRLPPSLLIGLEWPDSELRQQALSELVAPAGTQFVWFATPSCLYLRREVETQTPV